MSSSEPAKTNSKVAAIQMVSSSDVSQNVETAARLIDEAAGKGAALIVLPENFAVLDGGPQTVFAEQQGDVHATLQGMLSRRAREHGVFIVGGTLPLITRPLTAARYDKMHLFDVEVSDRQARYCESDSFEPGDQVVWVDTPVARLGLSICYDLRFPELYRRLFAEGVELITVPSAFTRVTGEAHWEVLLRARAIENQCYVIGCGQGGVHNAKRETFGHTMIIDPWGTVLSVLPQGEGVVYADLNLAMLHELRRKMPVHSHRRL